MTSLPKLMVAPNGARKTKADHPQLPITIEETVNAALECYNAGADGIHAHVRNDQAEHVLDQGLYKELICELETKVPGLAVQITTEAVGLYTAEQQRQLVKDVMPRSVSVSLAEMLSDDDLKAARNFYHFCLDAEISVQHILYSPEQLELYLTQMENGVIPNTSKQVLFVLGRYSEGQQSQPSDLDPFTDVLKRQSCDLDWAVCAFGFQETNCLLASYRAGGKVRVGFENSFYNSDGTIAKDNAERVAEIFDLTSV